MKNHLAKILLALFVVCTASACTPKVGCPVHNYDPNAAPAKGQKVGKNKKNKYQLFPKGMRQGGGR